MKFYGSIGYATEQKEGRPGVFQAGVVEREAYGDVLRNIRRVDTGENVNPDISLENSISVVADAYAREHFFAIRYVKWSGACWIVTTVEVQHPRLLLRLGGIYNGPKA